MSSLGGVSFNMLSQLQQTLQSNVVTGTAVNPLFLFGNALAQSHQIGSIVGIMVIINIVQDLMNSFPEQLPLFLVNFFTLCYLSEFPGWIFGTR
jgi:hypothetical protein